MDTEKWEDNVHMRRRTGGKEKKLKGKIESKNRKEKWK